MSVSNIWVCQSLCLLRTLHSIHGLNKPPPNSCSSGKAFQLRSALNQHRLGFPTLTHYGSVLLTHLTTHSKKLATPAPPPESSCIPEKPTPTWVTTHWKVASLEPSGSSTIREACLQLSRLRLAPSSGEQPLHSWGGARECSDSISQVCDLLLLS